MANDKRDQFERNMQGNNPNDILTRMGSGVGDPKPVESSDSDLEGEAVENVSVGDIDLEVDRIESFIESDSYESLKSVGGFGRLEAFALTFLNDGTPEEIAEKANNVIGVQEETYFDWVDRQREAGLLNLLGDRTALGRRFSNSIEKYMARIDTEPEFEGMGEKIAEVFSEYADITGNELDDELFEASELPDSWLKKARAKEEYDETMYTISSMEGVKMPLFEAFVGEESSFSDLKERYECVSEELGLNNISEGNFYNWMERWQDLGLIEETEDGKYTATDKGKAGFEMASEHAEALEKYQERLEQRRSQIGGLKAAYEEASNIDSLIENTSEEQREYLDFSDAEPVVRKASSKLDPHNYEKES